jgi:hypothetical protein
MGIAASELIQVTASVKTVCPPFPYLTPLLQRFWETRPAKKLIGTNTTLISPPDDVCADTGEIPACCAFSRFFVSNYLLWTLCDNERFLC